MVGLCFFSLFAGLWFVSLGTPGRIQSEERAGQPAARQMIVPTSHRGDCFSVEVLLLLFTRSRAINL